MAALDEEERTGEFLSLLNVHADGASPAIDQAVSSGLCDVLAMPHNARVGPRLTSYLAPLAADPSSAAAAACVAAALTAPAISTVGVSLGPGGRAALLSALEQVGLGARRAPFPAAPGAPCEVVRGVIVSAAGDRLSTHRKEPLWTVVCPLASGKLGGSGRCFAVVRAIKKCIGGEALPRP